MPEKILVVAVHSDCARISVTGDLADVLSAWRRRHSLFLPVVADECGDLFGDAGAAIAAFGFRVPSVIPTRDAAQIFGRLGVAQRLLPIVTRHIRQLGPHDSGLLLSEWAKAVTATSVASGH